MWRLLEHGDSSQAAQLYRVSAAGSCGWAGSSCAGGVHLGRGTMIVGKQADKRSMEKESHRDEYRFESEETTL